MSGSQNVSHLFLCLRQDAVAMAPLAVEVAGQQIRVDVSSHDHTLLATEMAQ